jgi:HD-GYP domain-containing protein (c-di-GMP phosphodiesterase class II)
MVNPISRPLEQHQLVLKLRPLVTGQLYIVGKLKHAAYVWEDGLFHPIFAATEVPSKEKIKQLISDQVKEVYLFEKDIKTVQDILEQSLIKVTRSLSVGDPKENGGRALKLMALNLNSVYQNPHSDELLMKQFQSSQNMAKFLMENKKLQANFFKDIAKENFHFTINQPMLSSILLIGFLQSIHLFHEREIETLFLTSLMKDIGIGLIPEDKYDIKGLTIDDQKLFAHHAHFSFEILEGRVPLTKNQLSIIKHHHFLNDRLKKILAKEKPRSGEDGMVFGIESTMVAVADIVVAMTSDRPYRQGLSVYQSLELIRKMIGDEYPQEFRALVVYLKNFFRP